MCVLRGRHNNIWGPPPTHPHPMQPHPPPHSASPHAIGSPPPTSVTPPGRPWGPPPWGPPWGTGACLGAPYQPPGTHLPPMQPYPPSPSVSPYAIGNPAPPNVTPPGHSWGTPPWGPPWGPPWVTSASSVTPFQPPLTHLPPIQPHPPPLSPSPQAIGNPPPPSVTPSGHPWGPLQLRVPWARMKEFVATLELDGGGLPFRSAGTSSECACRGSVLRGCAACKRQEFALQTLRLAAEADEVRGRLAVVKIPSGFGNDGLLVDPY